MRAPGQRLDRRPVGANAKIGPRQLNGRRQIRSPDLTAAVAAAKIDPPVRARLRAIHAPFQRAGFEAREEGLAKIHATIAVSIGQINDVRRTGHDQAPPRRTKPVAGRQVIGPNLSSIQTAVAIGVEQELDAAVRAGQRGLLRLVVRLHAPHDTIQFARLVKGFDVELAFQVVAVQFANKESPLFVPTNARRLPNQRLGSKQLQPKTCRELNLSGAGLRSKRRRRIVGLRNLADHLGPPQRQA